MKKIIKTCVLAIMGVLVAACASAVTLTSMTMEESTDTGAWTNAPGKIWSTNTGDPLTQLGVVQDGVFMNQAGSGGDLGEITIDLKPGINSFELYGTSVYGGSNYYGLALFFNGQATPPDMAVYNSNLSDGDFSVTPEGTKISGSANGGLFPDTAPGSCVFSTSDGATVRLIEFNVAWSESNPDAVSWKTVAPDGHVDTYATVKLYYTPAPTIVEYPIPTADSRPVDLVVDPYGNVWFTQRSGEKIGKCSPSGVMTEYPVTCSSPFGIAHDPNKNVVYYTGGEYNNGIFGVLNTLNGNFAEFPTGQTASSAVDGTLALGQGFWFNGWDSGTLSRADYSGNITHYVIPSFGYTSGISEDPQGNFWLTRVGAFESNPSLIKFTPYLAQPDTSKGFSEISLPYSQATARCPVAALGKIWLPLMAQSKIISYDPGSGSVEEYDTPTPNAVPQRIAVDKWHRLWFAESGANKIGMLDLRIGAIVEFPVPTTDSAPTSVAIDMDRDIIWFVEESGNKIGRLTCPSSGNPYIQGDFDNDGDVDGDDLSVFSTQFGK